MGESLCFAGFGGGALSTWGWVGQRSVELQNTNDYGTFMEGFFGASVKHTLSNGVDLTEFLVEDELPDASKIRLSFLQHGQSIDFGSFLCVCSCSC